jgi:hypothetical protein
MKLTPETFNEILSELENTPIISDKEYKKLISIVERFDELNEDSDGYDKTVEPVEGEGKVSNKKFVWYSLTNEKLKDLLSSISKRDKSELLTIYTIDAYPPEFTVPHIDKASELTLTILLEDTFEGGDYIVNGNRVTHMNEKGSYIMWKGKTDIHSCEPLTKGFKKTLIAWYRKPTTLL